MRYRSFIMKRKNPKKSKPAEPKKAEAKAKTVPYVAGVPSAPVSQISGTFSPPPPDILLEEAEAEPNYRDLGEYFEVMRRLRDKGFSYREIAGWLSERGVDADHNAVYRVYMRNLSDDEAHMEEQEADREAQEEAARNS